MKKHNTLSALAAQAEADFKTMPDDTPDGGGVVIVKYKGAGGNGQGGTGELGVVSFIPPVGSNTPPLAAGRLIFW